MLIKIAKAPFNPIGELTLKQSYILIDKVDRIENFSVTPEEFISNQDLRDFVANCEAAEFDTEFNYDRILNFTGGSDESVGSQITDNLSEKKVYRVNMIEYIKNNVVETIAFDTIGYICNDKGETLEKCFAGGILNK